MTRPCHVLGNGASRKEWTHPGDDTFVIGCNAAYRDVEGLDALAVCDTEMMAEVFLKVRHLPVIAQGDLQSARLQAKLDMVPPNVERFLWNRARGGSGMVALGYAVRCGFQPIILIGFDGGGPSIYDGTACYPKPGDGRPNLAERAIIQSVKFFSQKHPHIYYRPPAGRLENVLLPEDRA